MMRSYEIRRVLRESEPFAGGMTFICIRRSPLFEGRFTSMRAQEMCLDACPPAVPLHRISGFSRGRCRDLAE